MKQNMVIYPRKFTTKEKHMYFLFWSLSIGLTLLLSMFVLTTKLGSVSEAWRQSRWLIIGLLVFIFLFHIKREPFIISSQEMRYKNVRYNWSDVQSARLAQVDESGDQYEVLLLEVKNQTREMVASELIRNFEQVQPMNPDKTIMIILDMFPKHKIQEIMTWISRHTKTYSPVKASLVYDE